MNERTPEHLNGAPITRRKGVILIPLPRAAWRSCGACACYHCKDTEGYWDTLAIAPTAPERSDTTWMVHAPELHRVQP
jgi:hypothetical protein